MTGFLIALKFLTRLPVRVSPEHAGDLARAAPWLPAVGALVGVLVALGVTLGMVVGPWVGALLGLLVWVLITGGLHVEGLGDVADGLGAAHGNPERFVEVARDPHLGSFGAIAIALQLVAKLVLLAAVAERTAPGELFAGLALSAAWARWATLAVGRAVKPLTEGLASHLAAGITTTPVAVEGAALAAISLAVAPPLLIALPLAAAFALYWRARVGGMTGDCHGAGIEIMESLLLFALLLA
ncbi:adenosylcobinamide-GDP ribazoletransferase [Hyphomicrobium sp.]|uniref:adenosylcobinamide-GDP ribazoletransferase n=1 Tax=Hyphomicrobium sp. TaxID=82 RepID=UPI0025BBC74D|nr:adenosylcobinamide-GDP ribazoletransferase [Hyphomicrobium sp.]MCC7254200.1 adenosylcobinamide-GDP ribazoletransferase [Hyphomicrobium sp.]